MTGQVRRSRLAVAVLLVALAVLAWLPAQAQDAVLRLRLLSTTDIHTYVVDYDYYRDQRDASLGLSRTAALIQQARAEVKNSLLFDSGDAIQGNPLGDYVAVEQPLQPGQIHPVFKALNQFDDAAATLGNHEFNYGLGFLRATLAGANFPYVTSNVFVAEPDRAAAPPVIQPFVILDRDFVETTETNQEIIKDWLIAQGTVDAAATPIWSFVPIAQPVQVVFESSPEARSLVGAGTRILHVGEGQNGVALYSVSMR